MFNSLKELLVKKTEKNPDFKVFKAQKICENCQVILIGELNTQKIKVLNVKNNILSVSSQNKTISNEILLRKSVILKKINQETSFKLKDIKIV